MSESVNLPARSEVPLAPLTSFQIGGPAQSLLNAGDEQELVAAVSQTDAAGELLFVLSGGSNVLISDDGVPGTVVRVASKGIEITDATPTTAVLVAQAGELFDDVVRFAVGHRLSGLETLSGIPGLVGAAPVQNVGAYGSEVADSVAWVRAYDRQEHKIVQLSAQDCRFGYRTSALKASAKPGQPTGRWVVSAVGFSLLVSDMSEPIEYRELANRLGLEDGDQAPLGEVRQAVLGIRDQKGMLTTGQNATRSAGSFFMNPVIRPELAAELPPQAPKFELESGRVKTSAAWLIENAGFPKGYGRSAATLSPHHVLSIVNNGGAKASDVVELSAEIIAGVRKAFGITLVPEVVPVGVAFPKAAD